jgi:hypothetical protein
MKKIFTILLSLTINISYSQNIKEFLRIHENYDFFINDDLNKMVVIEKDTIIVDNSKYPVIIKTHITFKKGYCPFFNRFYNISKNSTFNRETYINKIEPLIKIDYENYTKKFDIVRSSYICE